MEVETTKSIGKEQTKNQIKTIGKYSKKNDAVFGVALTYYKEKVCILPSDKRSEKYFEKKNFKLCKDLVLSDYLSARAGK